MTISTLLTFDVMSQVKFSAEVRAEFGRFMQQEREKRGITQKYIADKIGKTVTQLSRIENGKSGTERDTVILWAQALGVDENEALRRYKPENNVVPDNKLSELAFHYPGIPEEKRGRVDYLVELLDNEIKKIEADKEKYGEE